MTAGIIAPRQRAFYLEYATVRESDTGDIRRHDGVALAMGASECGFQELIANTESKAFVSK